MSDTESLQLRFEALVCQQSSDQLLKLVEFLKIKDPVSKESKVQVVKIIRNFVEKLISDPGEIDIDAYLEDAIVFLTGQPPQKQKMKRNLLHLKKLFWNCNQNKPLSWNHIYKSSKMLKRRFLVKVCRCLRVVKLQNLLILW